MDNEQFDFLDLITIMSFCMGIQNLQQTDKTLETLKQHNEKIDLILKKQGEILDGLEREKGSERISGHD